jgi:hypothetical protein
VPRTRTVALILVLAWLGTAAAAVRAAPWLALAIIAAGVIVVGAARGAAGLPALRGAAQASARTPTLGRVERFLEAVDRLPTDRLRMLAMPEDPARVEAVERALQAAATAGRRETAADLRRTVDDGIARRFAEGGYDATMFGLGWRSEPTGPSDRVRIAATVRDAALGVLVEDLIDRELFEELVGPCADLMP